MPSSNKPDPQVERGTNAMASPDRKDLFPGALEMMVLRALSQEPRHGYALVQHIKRTSNDLLQVEEGSLYPALQRMLRGGLGEGPVGHVLQRPARPRLRDHAGRA